MKLNKNKIVVSALALAIGTSLVGSISGTVAWYQYSTRANVSFIGEAGGFSGNLQMRFVGDGDNAWKTRITFDDLNNKLAATGYAEKILPMTFGKMDRDGSLDGKKAYIQPIPGVADMAGWVEASKKNYAQFELELRYNERDGKKEGDSPANQKDDKNVEKKVYLSKLLLQEDKNNSHLGKKDLSDALRVHISSTYKEMDRTDAEHPVLGNAITDNKLISNKGGAILTEGTLDIDGDGTDDQGYPDGDEFGFDYLRDDDNKIIYDAQTGEPTRVGLQDIVYGEGAQLSYAAKSTYVQADAENQYLPYGKTAGQEVDAPIYPALAGLTNNKLDNLEFDDDLDGDGEGSTPKVDKFIGKTIESESEYLKVTITIWVEGWQQLQGSAIWDEVDYIKSNFNVGIQFAVEDAEF